MHGFTWVFVFKGLRDHKPSFEELPLFSKYHNEHTQYKPSYCDY